MTAILAFLGTLFILLPFNIPICFILLVCAFALLHVVGMGDVIIIAQSTFSGMNNAALMAIPFFMLSGEIMAVGGLSKRIVDFSDIIVGRFRGGLGYVVILASVIFAGLSGSAVADAAALGGILIPLMVDKGYSPERSTGLVCAGSIIAPIIPPSIPMIVLATAVGLSVSKAFMAGIIPGLILGVALVIMWRIIVVKDNYSETRTYTRAEKAAIIKDSIPALFMPILIVGGIRLGVFTPTEAGAFATVYAAVVCLFVYREMNFKDLIQACINATLSTGVTMFIVGAASAVGWLITVAQIPTMIVTALSSLIHRPLLLLLLINLFLFIMGMIMDLTPNLLIFGPVLFPLIKAAGIDPIAFAVIMVLNLTIGLITPPVGIVLYLGCGISKISLSKCVKGVMPFLIVEVITLLLFILFPQLISVPATWFY